MNGGLIHDLTTESVSDDTTAKKLGDIIANVKESLDPSYPPTPIINNLIGKLGKVDEAIVKDVKTLIENHIAISKGRIIEPGTGQPQSAQMQQFGVFQQPIQPPQQVGGPLPEFRTHRSNQPSLFSRNIQSSQERTSFMYVGLETYYIASFSI